MIEQVLWLVTTVLFIVSIFYAYKIRKKKGVKGWQSALTSICLFILTFMNILFYWTDFQGIISIVFSIVLLCLAAYFTKYLPSSRTAGK